MQLTEDRHNNVLWVQEKDIQKRIQQKSVDQEICWTHRAQKDWILLGVKNTKYLQTIAIIRKWQNYTWKINNKYGNWIRGPKWYSTGYYSEFAGDLRRMRTYLLTKEYISLSIYWYEDILVSLTNLLKMWGTDSMHATFNQKCWHIISKSICVMTNSFFKYGHLLKETNITYFNSKQWTSNRNFWLYTCKSLKCFL